MLISAARGVGYCLRHRLVYGRGGSGRRCRHQRCRPWHRSIHQRAGHRQVLPWRYVTRRVADEAVQWWLPRHDPCCLVLPQVFHGTPTKVRPEASPPAMRLPPPRACRTQSVPAARHKRIVNHALAEFCSCTGVKDARGLSVTAFWIMRLILSCWLSDAVRQHFQQFGRISEAVRNPSHTNSCTRVLQKRCSAPQRTINAPSVCNARRS